MAQGSGLVPGLGPVQGQGAVVRAGGGVEGAARAAAAGALWEAAAEALAAVVTAAGAVVQAELLRAAHTARLAGLPRAEAAALRPLAVGPVPGAEYSLRLPEEWLGRADLGYDRLQGSHFPPPRPAPDTLGATGPDPLADSPLWRVRRLLETGVAGGRRAVAEGFDHAPLRRAGFATAAELATALAAEAARRHASCGWWPPSPSRGGGR
ncbi:hypothetical protein [Streptomyces sp. NPDC048340]|uniref:hypothetical protein n=1 Tax=Streptomyces sp. NPDC048340 TaxID=3365537 RepID=UPI0037210E59